MVSVGDTTWDTKDTQEPESMIGHGQEEQKQVGNEVEDIRRQPAGSRRGIYHFPAANHLAWP